MDHDSVHLIVCDVSVLSEVDWVNNFIISISLVAVQIFRLPTVA
jgi:hypothetical protein